MCNDLDDFLGTTRGDLIQALPYEAAERWLKPNSEALWVPWTEERVRAEAVGYLEFAWGKARNHRGLSAARSVDHYAAWLWLLFDDASYASWADTPYPLYGTPQLAAAAELLGQPLPTDPELVRMMAGKPCEPDCLSGC